MSDARSRTATPMQADAPPDSWHNHISGQTTVVTHEISAPVDRLTDENRRWWRDRDSRLGRILGRTEADGDVLAAARRVVAERDAALKECDDVAMFEDAPSLLARIDELEQALDSIAATATAAALGGHIDTGTDEDLTTDQVYAVLDQAKAEMGIEGPVGQVCHNLDDHQDESPYEGWA